MSGKINFNLNINYKGCCILAAFVMLSTITFGQHSSTRNDLLRVLGYTTPGFQPSTDSAFMAGAMAKNYSLTTYLYNTTVKDSLTIDEKKFIDSLQLYITKRYVAEITLAKKTAAIKVDDTQALQYYNLHKEAYATPGKSTYIQAFIFKEDPAIIEKAKKMVLKMAANPDTAFNVADLKNTDYGIAIERNAPLVSFANITKYILELKPRQMSPLMQLEGNNSKSFLYVVDKTEKQYKPFSEVKETCRMMAKAEKTEEMMQQLMNEAVAKYPVPSK